MGLVLIDNIFPLLHLGRQFVDDSHNHDFKLGFIIAQVNQDLLLINFLSFEFLNLALERSISRLFSVQIGLSHHGDASYKVWLAFLSFFVLN